MEISDFVAGALSITIDRFSLFPRPNNLPARFIGTHARTTIISASSNWPSAVIRQSGVVEAPSAFNAPGGLPDDPSRHQADAIPGAVAVGALPPMSKSWAATAAAIVRVAVSSRTKHSKSVE
jgi:hypothetical protein